MFVRRALLVNVLAAGVVAAACGGTSVRTPTSPGLSAEASQQAREVPPADPQPAPSPPVDREPIPVPPAPLPPPGSDGCDASNVQWVVGERATGDLLERARVAAGASLARFIRPNEPITMEYIGSRLNLDVNAQDVVRGATCG